MNEVEELIKASLVELLKIGSESESVMGFGESTSKLIFPKYRDENKRVSEKEAVFLFVRELEKESQTKYYYSVETPTTKKYKFKGQENPIIDDGGRSASFDICLYETQDEQYERAVFIEFKALNPEGKSFSKDFLKLICDEDGLTNYFVHIIENSDSGTQPSIEGKYKDAIKNVIKNLSNEKSQLKIFLCDIEKKNITLFDVDDENQLREIYKE